MDIDWGVGEYEWTAADLLPAAEVVVEQAAIRPGERVVDVGCGTGNATLLAAQRGALVTGVDPAARLLDVARGRAAQAGLDITFVPGTAAAIPVADGAADVVLSVFAVIFAPDPLLAAAEMARVCSAGGRIVLSAWIPRGPIFEFTSAFGEAVAEAAGSPPRPPGFRWFDSAALAGLFEPHGLTVGVEEHSLQITAQSVSAYLEVQGRTHPMSIAGRALLQRSEQAGAVSARARAILDAANEDPAAFRVHSPYVVATIERVVGTAERVVATARHG